MESGESDGTPVGWFVDVDTPDEVDAVFRSLRRAALGHFGVFALVLGGTLLATLSLSWWTESSAIAGVSPAFVVVGAGLFLAFVIVGVSAVTLENAIEDSMMGSPEPDDPDQEPGTAR